MNTNPNIASESTGVERKKRIPALKGDLDFSSLPALGEKERISHWVKIHLVTLEKWNKQGWRWVKIAEGLSAHLKHPITRNKLTGMVSMIKDQKLAKKIEVKKSEEKED